MRDLTDPRLMYLKAVLFVLGGTVAAVLLLLKDPTPETAFLLGVVIWSFSRAYYFAFYVIEHYVDPTYKFSGLWSFCQYVLQKRRERR
jgi:hypothetical protein